MKYRVVCVLIAIVLSVTFFGCDSAKALQDGTYRAEYAQADDHGWTDYVVVTVLDGKISNVEYDALDENGNSKKSSVEYNEAMKGAGSTTWPSDFMPQLQNQLVDKQDIAKVDAIAGATTSSNDFVTLVKALKKNMENGNTETVKVKR